MVLMTNEKRQNKIIYKIYSTGRSRRQMNIYFQMAVFPTLYFPIQNTLHFSFSNEHLSNIGAGGMGLWTEARVHPFKLPVFSHGPYSQRKLQQV